ncbi:MAG TPA: hypothetical protein VIU40_06625, partial [Geobacteraceae bacterium]
WIGWGQLWVPSQGALYRVKVGESKPRGPELVGRPDYRFWVRGGVEFGDAQYLLCTDEAASGATVIVKMVKDEMGLSGREYRFYEWCRLPGATKGYFIGVFGKPTNPTLVVGYGNNAYCITLGRGGGRMVDDANYQFGTAMEVESGRMQVGPDLSVISTLVGVQVLCDYSRAGESLTISAAFDSDAYRDLLSSQEGNGVASINHTDGWESVIRYAPPDMEGNALQVKLTGALTSASGTTRPEIREAYAFGYLRPRQTDIVNVNIVADGRTSILGNRFGMSGEQIHNFWRRALTLRRALEIEIDQYESNKPTRFMVVDVDATNVSVQASPGGKSKAQRVVRVTLARADFAGEYALD